MRGECLIHAKDLDACSSCQDRYIKDAVVKALEMAANIAIDLMDNQWSKKTSLPVVYDIAGQLRVLADRIKNNKEMI